MSESPTVLLSRVGIAGAGDGGPVEIQVPKQIGPVRLIRQIGAGAMGLVWLGHHEVLARDVAVKFLLSKDATPGEGPAFESFIQGARAAAAVRHSGLTAVHDAGAVNGVPYIVMEFVNGPTLSDLLRHGPLPLNIARTVLHEVCDSVAELHEGDLVHRDLKPSNIMVGEDGSVIVTDFGLACPRPASRGVGGPIAGTAPYMSCEMFEGDISPRSDIYAIGVTAFELLTGRLPYEGGFHEIKAAAGAGVVPRDVLEASKAPPGVIDAIERAMNKDGLYRPKTLSRLQDLFDRGFEQAGVAAASRDQVQGLAFPGMLAPEKSEKPRVGSSAMAAATTFDLIAARAEEKRKSDLAMPPPELSPEPVAAPLESLPVYVQPASPVSAASVTYAPVPAARPKPAPFVVKKVKRKKAPIPWSLVLVCALGASIVILGPSLFSGLFRPGPRISLLFLAMWPVVVLAMFIVFHKAALSPGRRRSLEGGVVCGWCGYQLAGTKGEKCPECGHAVDDGGGPGNKPPSKRWGARFVAVGWGVAGVFGFFAGGEALMTLTTPLVARLDSRWQEVANNFLALAIVVVPTCVAGLLFYFSSARTSALFDGLARCGECGAVVKGAGCGKCKKE